MSQERADERSHRGYDVPHAVPPISTPSLGRFLSTMWNSPRVLWWRGLVARWQKLPYAGTMTLAVGLVLTTLVVLFLDRMVVVLPNPGLVYLPVVAMLAYHWKWRYAIIAALLSLFCVYYLFLPPRVEIKALTPAGITQLLTLAAVTGFVMGLVGLARQRRTVAEQAARHLEALNRVGTALASELDEDRLLHLIAEAARNLTGAAFAAFTLRPTNTLGQPVVPAEGNLFYLAAVVGVTKEQETLFRHMPLGGEGLLAPIFRNGVPVLIADAMAMTHQDVSMGATTPAAERAQFSKEAARHRALAYSQGLVGGAELRYIGVPRGHPVVRSFLGAPLLDRNGQVRGGMLLGHTEPDRFTLEHEALLVGLAAQAAVALENARLYSAAQTQAQELDAIFESIADGITLIDEEGALLRENRTARHLREALETNSAAHLQQHANGAHSMEFLLRDAAERALKGDMGQGIPVTLLDEYREMREYSVHASPLRPPGTRSGPLQKNQPALSSASAEQPGSIQVPVTGAVVVWHDVTEARRLLRERQAHAETEARRAFLQTIIDELPSSVYLVRGHDARLVLANRVTKEIWGASWPYGQPISDFLAENGIRVAHSNGQPLRNAELATLRAVQNGESIYHQQEVIRHRDGTTLPVLVNAVALNPAVLGGSQDDAEPAAIVVHQDVTALKEAERLKDEFIGIAAHELRTPLAALKGFAQTLLIQTARGKGPPLSGWQMEAVEEIDQATQRLVELTEDLLDVTRLQGGRLELRLVPSDLVALTQRVTRRLRVPAEQYALSIAAREEYVVAAVDPARFEQVLNNLISNAVKYSPAGGKVTVTIEQDTSAETALISICDEGIGIPVQDQPRLFGRFTRAENARLLGIGGTGLGLYLCRELVERHDGRIWFESVEGQGSTFFISLPLHIDTVNDL
ncbi:MAG: ATP-binding protein [Ktedonobacteraceae bacterium]